MAAEQATKNGSISEEITWAPARASARESAPIPQVASLTQACGILENKCAARAFAAASELALESPEAVINSGASLIKRDLERKRNSCSSAHLRAKPGSNERLSRVATFKRSRSSPSPSRARCACSLKSGSVCLGRKRPINENSDLEPERPASYFRILSGTPRHLDRVTVAGGSASLTIESSPEGIE